MTLKYKWFNVPVQKLSSVISAEPIYYTTIGNVEYEFECDTKLDDIIAYVMPNKYQVSKYDRTMVRKVLTDMYVLFAMNGALDINALDNDEDFVEFMKERYEDEAFDEYKESFY